MSFDNKAIRNKYADHISPDYLDEQLSDLDFTDTPFKKITKSWEICGDPNFKDTFKLPSPKRIQNWGKIDNQSSSSLNQTHPNASPIQEIFAIQVETTVQADTPEFDLENHINASENHFNLLREQSHSSVDINSSILGSFQNESSDISISNTINNISGSQNQKISEKIESQISNAVFSNTSKKKKGNQINKPSGSFDYAFGKYSELESMLSSKKPSSPEKKSKQSSFSQVQSSKRSSEKISKRESPNIRSSVSVDSSHLLLNSSLQKSGGDANRPTPISNTSIVDYIKPHNFARRKSDPVQGLGTDFYNNISVERLNSSHNKPSLYSRSKSNVGSLNGNGSGINASFKSSITSSLKSNLAFPSNASQFNNSGSNLLNSDSNISKNKEMNESDESEQGNKLIKKRMSVLDVIPEELNKQSQNSRKSQISILDDKKSDVDIAKSILVLNSNDQISNHCGESNLDSSKVDASKLSNASIISYTYINKLKNQLNDNSDSQIESSKL